MTVIAGSAIAYQFMDHQISAVQPAPASTPLVAKALPVPSPVPPAAKAQAKHPLRAVMSTLGMASFYSNSFDGKRTANGETFDQKLMTACHKTLPFGTLVRVINVATGRSVVVRINDRGVLTPSRVIDLSHAAASELGMLESGVAKVRLEILGRARAAEVRPL